MREIKNGLKGKFLMREENLTNLTGKQEENTNPNNSKNCVTYPRKTIQRIFGEKIGKLGTSNERKSSIPWKVYTLDGSIETNPDKVLATWKDGYQKLCNESNQHETYDDDFSL